MKTRVLFALVALVLSMLLHGYLTMSFYPLKLGFSTGESLCKVSDTFDCQAVSASAYSSFLGFPLSVWGLVTNGILFLMVLFAWWRVSANPERLWRMSFVLAAISLGASVVMATISFTQMSVYCMFCLFLYGFSLLVFEMLREIQAPGFMRHLLSDAGAMVTDAKGIAAFFVAIPALAFLVHHTMLSQYGAEELDRMIRSSVADWAQAQTQTFSSPPLLVFGPDTGKARMVISEFADFRCSHCKHAAPSLDAFKKSHPDVRMEYFAFPLDSECNKEMHQGNGVSCALSKSVLCADAQGFGWKLHEALFSNYEALIPLNSQDATMTAIKKITDPMGVAWEALNKCVESPETHERILKMVETGVAVGVEGTPTIFVNGKKLSRGQLLPVLEKAYSEVGKK